MRAGGIAAVLSFLEFFPVGVQLTALEAAVTMSRRISREQFDSIVGVVPVLLPLISQQNERLLPLVVSFFFNTVDCLQSRLNVFFFLQVVR